jgi:hypothetical protein
MIAASAAARGILKARDATMKYLPWLWWKIASIVRPA